MKYIIFRYNGGEPTIFVETRDGVSRFSDDKEEDEFFANWYKNMTKENGGKKPSFDDVTTGWSYYDAEEGKYEDDKAKVAKLIEDLGYDAP